MAVVSMQPKSEVNYIGQSPALTRLANPDFGSLRTPPKKVQMISPDGVEEAVLRDNVRDYIRLRNYKLKDGPQALVSDEARASNVVEEISTAEEKASQERMDEVQTALDVLDTLRKELEERGVEVDKRWGLKRLQTELMSAPDKQEYEAADSDLE